MQRFRVGLVTMLGIAMIPLGAVAGNEEVAAGLSNSGQMRGFGIKVRYKDATAGPIREVSTKKQMQVAPRVASKTGTVLRITHELGVKSDQPNPRSLQHAAEAISREKIAQAVSTDLVGTSFNSPEPDAYSRTSQGSTATFVGHSVLPASTHYAGHISSSFNLVPGEIVAATAGDQSNAISNQTQIVGQLVKAPINQVIPPGVLVTPMSPVQLWLVAVPVQPAPITNTMPEALPLFGGIPNVSFLPPQLPEGSSKYAARDRRVRE